MRRDNEYGGKGPNNNRQQQRNQQQQQQQQQKQQQQRQQQNQTPLSPYKPPITLLSGLLLSQFLFSFFSFLQSLPSQHPRLLVRCLVLKSLFISSFTTYSSICYFKDNALPIPFQTIYGLLAGHFLYDIYAYRHMWIKHKSTLLHHFLCFYLSYSMTSLRSERSAIRHKAPHFLLMNLSTAFLNLSWLTKEAHLFYLSPLPGGLFILSFIFTRFFVVPYLVLERTLLGQNIFGHGSERKRVKRAFILFQLLMVYWGMRAAKNCLFK